MPCSPGSRRDAADRAVGRRQLPVRIAAPLAVEPTDSALPGRGPPAGPLRAAALIAAREAWADAGSPEVDQSGSASGSAPASAARSTLLDQDDILEASGMRKVSPHTVPMLMPNGPAAVGRSRARSRRRRRRRARRHGGWITGAIAQNAPLTIALAKASAREIAKPESKQDHKKLEKMAQACFDSDDYKEGRRAFMEKRKPAFKGRERWTRPLRAQRGTFEATGKVPRFARSDSNAQRASRRNRP